MQNKKAIWGAVVIGIILIAIILYAVFRGEAKPLPNGTGQPENGIRYIPPGAKDLDGNEV